MIRLRTIEGGLELRVVRLSAPGRLYPFALLSGTGGNRPKAAVSEKQEFTRLNPVADLVRTLCLVGYLARHDKA